MHVRLIFTDDNAPIMHYCHTFHKINENTEQRTWLLAAAPIDRFLGPKDTHALKSENKFSQHSACSSSFILFFQQ